MTIHRTLLTSYLLISLASALLIALMIFAHFRNILRQEIEHKLESQAITIMQQIDMTLFERMHNMASWSHLEIMQDLRTRDVDKRLAQFLHELHTEYEGVYHQLFVVNQDHKTIASSHSHFMGKQQAMTPTWLTTNLKEHRLTIDNPTIAANYLTISIPIGDDFQETQLGRLYAHFNWQEITRLLDKSVSGHSLNSIYYSLLLDSKGRVIAHSSNLQDKLVPFQYLERNFLKKNQSGAFEHSAAFLAESTLIGYSRAQGYRTFSGLDWRVLILHSSDLAYAPILKLWHVLVLFVGLTLFLGTFVSFWMSAKISKPITRLAKSTRDFMAGKPTKLRPIKASTEITELNTQFAEMIDNLEQSRLDIARVAKLAVMGEMAASMAHEVRTPLGILRSSAQMLQRDTQLSAVSLEMTEFILSETKRLNDLISLLLECARPRAPKFALHPVEMIITHVTELLRSKIEAKQIKLTLNFNHHDQLLLCDKDQFIQILLNLIMNAAQHVEIKGQIKISTQIIQQHLEISVCDNGSGISNENKHAVFDPFFTRRQEGIGLGLTVVQQIVLAHHAQIFIRDNPNGGSCFHVQFKLSTNELN
ncbi:MAG: sensor histidine kinase [Methylococcales bacterium]|nr:sensor histidine kinase [Methylococcales bacterium]